MEGSRLDEERFFKTLNERQIAIWFLCGLSRSFLHGKNGTRLQIYAPSVSQG